MIGEYIINRKKPRFTEPEIKRLDDMIASGKYGITEIAEVLGKHFNSVKVYCTMTGRIIPNPYRKQAESQIYERKALEKIRPSFHEIAVATLGGAVRFDAHDNYLLVNGKYRPASINEIGRRVNAVRRENGLSQILDNPAWGVE